jgi:phospholipid/cholesterol/gamma-HCH transport system substrate-binding protein
MTKRNIEVMVGVFVLAGMVGLLFLALKAANLGNFTTGSTYRIAARFDNVGGLKPRAPVKSAGVTVGRVASISLDRESFQGIVTLELEQRFQFPKDTSAKILTSGLLGDQYVGLEPGGDDKDLAAGDVIRMTQSAVVLENLIGQFLFNKAAEGGDSKGGETKGGNAKK